MLWVILGLVGVCLLASASFALGAMWGGRRNGSNDDDLAVSERMNTVLRYQLAEVVHHWNTTQQRVIRLEYRLRQKALAKAAAN